MKLADERITNEPVISVEPAPASRPDESTGITNVWLSIIYIILGVLIIGILVLLKRRKANPYSNFTSGGDNNPTPGM